MKGENLYTITSLPTLGELGSPPPMTPAEMLDHIADSETLSHLLGAIFLCDDLIQREAILAGEIQQAEPTVLTVEQLRNEQPLPDYLEGEPNQTARIAADATWETYYRYVADVAVRQGSIFLAEWTGYEVALRNALVEARAKQLELDAEYYLVAPDLAASIDASAVINEWASAANPLAGLKVLDSARWAWLAENDAWFSFSNDELAAYAARLMLLHRWNRITADDGDRNTDTTMDERNIP